MTEFKKTSKAVEEMGEYLATVMSEGADAVQKKKALDAGQALADAHEAKVLKMKAKADEKDPDKRLYGEQMAQKVVALHDRFFEIAGQLEEMASSVAAWYAPHLEAQRRSAEEAAAAEAAEAAAAAAEREAREAAEAAEREAAEAARRERERERQARHEETVRRAEEAAAQERRELEEEKELLDRLLRRLNATPTRILLRDGVRRLHDDCLAGRVAPAPAGKHPALRAFDDAVRTLHAHAVKLAGHPDDFALKHLRFANENFAREIVGRGEGALTVLYSLGYRPCGFGDAKGLVLEEPNVLADYEAWQKWWEEVCWTRDYLDALVDSLREHRRGVADEPYRMAAHLPLIPQDVLELHVARQQAPIPERRYDLAIFS